MRVNREEFLASLELLRPGLSPQETVEQSSCIIFKDGYAMTYNDEVSCYAKYDLGFEGAVVATPLIDLLHKMIEEDLEIEASDSELRVIGKKRKAGIRLEAEITSPVEGSLERPEKWRKVPVELIDAIKLAEQCAGTDESAFSLTCVHIHPNYIEACDNVQALRYTLETGFETEFLVRRDSIKHIVSMGITHFSETETWVHFRNSRKLVLSCRRFIEDYHQLDDLFDMKGASANLPRGLAEAADRAEVFSSQNQDDNHVKIDLKPGKLTIEGRGSSGWYSERKKVKYSGKPISFLIAPKLLSEIVKEHQTCEITKDRLKVDGGKFQFVACLALPDDVASEDGEIEDENG